MAIEIATPIRSLNVEEYLKLDRECSVKYEYVGGELYAFAEASDEHNRLATTLTSLLWQTPRGSMCRVYVSDMKLQVAEDVIYYPDVMVVCDPNDNDRYIKINPVLVAEVLSPSTQQIDLREKLLNYRRLENLRTYLIAYQDHRRIIRHWRDEEGTWRLADVSIERRVPIPHLEVEFTVDDIYEGIIPPSG